MIALRPQAIIAFIPPPPLSLSRKEEYEILKIIADIILYSHQYFVILQRIFRKSYTKLYKGRFYKLARGGFAALPTFGNAQKYRFLSFMKERSGLRD
ncbi:MAG: hypothetical protein MJZ54_06420 [Bacteroidaceae bacterium]|nr:hypothetical protein [Bacteroidaceae bacterium]